MNSSNLNESYGTLSETINALIKWGYTYDFNILPENGSTVSKHPKLSPTDFQIDKVYRFEGETNPADQSILYAISSSHLNIKGTLVNGYGVSSNEEVSNLIDQLSTHPEVGG